MNGIPKYLVDMVRRPAPQGCGVVQGSTPVVAFGDPRRAEVATIGINPSSAEFVDNKGRLLAGVKRRLATLESLGATSPESLSDDQVAEVIDDCSNYFQRRPYGWFKAFDTILEEGLGASYRSGSACHIDIAQWATSPVWSGLPAGEPRESLLREGAVHLQQQLLSENIRFVIVNGRTVWDQLLRLQLVRLIDEEHVVFDPAVKNSHTTFRTAEGCGATFIGWTLNLQAQGPGMKAPNRLVLADLVRRKAEGSSHTEAEVGADDGHLTRREVASRSEFVSVLDRWFTESDAATIGNIASFGGRPLVRLDLGGGRVVSLNADTKRPAVALFLEYARSNGADAPWRVMANQKGVWNKVDFTRDGAPTPGWYCYVSPAADGERLL